MATPLINNWVTLELVCQIDGQTVENVFSYKSSVPSITEGELAAFVTGWASIMGPLYQNASSSSLLLEMVRAKTHFPTATNVESDYLFPSGTYGTQTGDASSNNATAAVKLLTGAIGRSRRGRTYMMGLWENATQLSHLLSSYLTVVSIFFARNLTGFSYSSITYIPAVASRKKLDIHELTGFTIDNLIDSQRRRLVGRGS